MEITLHENCGGEILTRQEVIEYGTPQIEDGKVIIETNSLDNKLTSLVLGDVTETICETQVEPYCDFCHSVIDFNEIIVRDLTVEQIVELRFSGRIFEMSEQYKLEIKNES